MSSPSNAEQEAIRDIVFQESVVAKWDVNNINNIFDRRLRRLEEDYETRLDNNPIERDDTRTFVMAAISEFKTATNALAARDDIDGRLKELEMANETRLRPGATIRRIGRLELRDKLETKIVTDMVNDSARRMSKIVTDMINDSDRRFRVEMNQCLSDYHQSQDTFMSSLLTDFDEIIGILSSRVEDDKMYYEMRMERANLASQKRKASVESLEEEDLEDIIDVLNSRVEDDKMYYEMRIKRANLVSLKIKAFRESLREEEEEKSSDNDNECVAPSQPKIEDESPRCSNRLVSPMHLTFKTQVFPTLEE